MTFFSVKITAPCPYQKEIQRLSIDGEFQFNILQERSPEDKFTLPITGIMSPYSHFFDPACLKKRMPRGGNTRERE